MRFFSRCFLTTLAAGLAFAALSSSVSAQQTGFSPQTAVEVPDAPQPQGEVAALDPLPMPSPVDSSQSSSSSTSQPAATQSSQKSQHDTAEEQMKEQEKQRVVGVLPSFNVSYRADAVSLSGAQKIRLAFRSAVDPVSFAAGFIVAGYHEAKDDNIGFGWGPEGYGKRAGAAYLDGFNGTMIGNGILPAVLHQDPRYFRLGHGTVKHRLLYALATNVICKHDNTHKWEPNYSNVAGNIISGAISNLYYPADGSGISQTFTNGMIVTAEGGFGSIFQEFWPDISRKFLHKDPTHGLDAQMRAADAKSK